MNKFMTQSIADRMTAFDMISFLKILPNPDPILAKLGRRMEVYDDLLYDDQVRACMSSRKAGINRLNSELEQKDCDQKVYDFIKDVFDNVLDLNDCYDEILDSVSYGYQPIEITWGVYNGNIVPVKFEGKPADWFTFDTDNKLKFLSKKAPIYGEDVPDMKFLCPTHMSNYRNPFGVSALSACFWPVAFKKGGMRFWTTFIEKYGTPWVVGKYKPGTPKPEIDDLHERIDNAIQDAVLVVKEGTDIQIVEAGGKSASSDIFDRYEAVCDARISKALLGQTLTTEITGTGSYAASKTHNEVRKDIILSDARIVQKALNVLIRWMTDLNFGKGVPAPQYCFYEPDEIDSELATRDETLTRTGVKFTKKYYARVYNLQEDDFDITETPAAINPPHNLAAPDARRIEPLKTLENAMNIESLKAEMLEPFFRIVRESIETGGTYTGMIDTLIEKFPEADLSEIEKKLERAIFIMTLLGYSENSEK